jgi:hypothetical protein
VPDSVAVVDLFRVAPPLRLEFPIFIKATVSAYVPFEKHCESFRPDFRILFLRNPADTWQSLVRKRYKNNQGTPTEKLCALERAYARRDELFDLVVTYEEFVRSPVSVLSLLRLKGIALPDEAIRFPRGPRQIADYAISKCNWCRDNYLTEWGFGNVHFMDWGSIRTIHYAPITDDVEDAILSACPQVAAHYKILRPDDRPAITSHPIDRMGVSATST